MPAKNPPPQAAPSSPEEDVTKPILSVVIPAWFSSGWLPQTLESLQLCPVALDIVVVENGSQELSLENIKTHTGKHVVTLIHRKTADLSSARNVGLLHTQGEWVLFLDSDDIIDIRGVIPHLSDSALAEVDVVALGKEEFRDTDISASPLLHRPLRGEEKEEPTSPSIMAGGTYLLGELASHSYSPVTGGFIFRRSHLNNLGVSFSEGFFHEDHAFVAGVIARSSRVAKTPGKLFFKRLLPTSLTRQMSREVSLSGYRQAIDDLSKTAEALKQSNLGPRLALNWILAHLAVIETRKSLAVVYQGPVPPLRGLLHSASNIARFVAVSALGSVVAMFLRLSRSGVPIGSSPSAPAKRPQSEPGNS